MTAEVNMESAQMFAEQFSVDDEQEFATAVKNTEESPADENKLIETEAEDVKSLASTNQKNGSFREESSCLSDLKDNEKRALADIRAKLEDAILENKLSSSVDNAEADDKGISLWGVQLLPSNGDESTDVVLLKFLRAREFKVIEAFEMLQKTLKWRKESNIDSILEEDLYDEGFSGACYMDGVDREGHLVCYNVYGVFNDNKLYQKTFGSEKQRQKFLRWRVQLMEKGIKELDFKPGGVSSMVQVVDLKNSPWISKKELRSAVKQALDLLQDNYPEFVARNILVNVPFWYYALHAIISPFLTPRTKSKFVFARSANVTETLLKYIAAEQLPVTYGGLKRENDQEFFAEDVKVSELILKAGSIQTIEIPAPEVGITIVWDLTVLGWEVNYKEEFVPIDGGSYTVIIQKGKKMGSQEVPIRNSYKNTEAGKVVLTVENNTYKKKKVLYRYEARSN